MSVRRPSGARTNGDGRVVLLRNQRTCGGGRHDGSGGGGGGGGGGGKGASQQVPRWRVARRVAWRPDAADATRRMAAKIRKPGRKRRALCFG